ncbi:MAG TPA: hypothetical protein VM283_06390, partial [Armatimonadota bacterium]|nr:hypothetical protein [Armatimonadota bacterium]
DRPEAPELAAKLAGGEVGVRQVGQGRVYCDPRALPEIPAAEVLEKLRAAAGEPAVSFALGSAKMVVNVMRSGDGRTLQAHVVNYDFDYRDLWPAVRDDDGSGEARMPFTNTVDQAKKLLVADPDQFTEPAISFAGNSPSGENYSLVVSVNGEEIATLPAADLLTGGWISVPFDRALLRPSNEVVIRAIGSPNAHPDYFNLRIDTGAPGGRSFASHDGGQTWSSADLSPWDGDDQPGEYLIRLTQQRDPTQRIPVEKLLASYTVNPTPAVTLTVRDLPGELRAVAIAPDHEPIALEVTRNDDMAQVTIPPTRIGNIVVISRDGGLMDALAGG